MARIIKSRNSEDRIQSKKVIRQEIDKKVRYNLFLKTLQIILLIYIAIKISQ